MDLALEARCVYALYKVTGRKHTKDLEKALRLARKCGRETYPNTVVSRLIIDEPELLEAYQEGWAAEEDKNRPRTSEELKAIVERLADEANHGCGQYYELFVEKLNHLADDWLQSLHPENVAEATKLLEAQGYESDPEGSWSYDHEEGDIVYTRYDKA